MYPAFLSFASMMNSLMDLLTNNHVTKVVSYVFWSTYGLGYSILMEQFFNMLYFLYVGMLNLVWLLEQAFDVFAGTQNVYFRNGAGVAVSQADFMTAVFIGSPVQNAYWYMMLSAVVVCFFTTIIAVIQSMGEGLSELKRPVTAVIRQAFQAILSFALIPTACLAVMKVGAAVTKVILYFGDEQGDKRISDIVFTLTVGDKWVSDAAREACSSGRMFTSISVRKYFNWREINYVYAYILLIFMIIVMITIIMQAIMRAMMLAVLFITSPWFVSMIPIDGGEKFKSWSRLFTGFTFSTFGPMLVMRVYCVLLTSIGIDGTISFGDEFNPITAWILRMAITGFGMVGAWQSQYIILDIFSPETTNLLKQSQFLAKMAGDTVKKAASAAAAYATGGASKAGQLAGNMISGMGKQNKD
ncbi:Mbov_0396 family ICE element transmembrane protein [Lachnospiraceae bacterium C1.1]|nr:hypothetical protein [Lachnospiraceae bacterium C1.1]